MESIFVDESGSMTVSNSAKNDFFSICLVRVKNIRGLRSSLKRYIGKNIDSLKQSDSKRNKMFCGDKFIELKGSCLSRKLKIDLANYLCQNDYFDIFYITFENKIIDPKLYRSTSRAFNFAIDQLLSCAFKNDKLPLNQFYVLNIDERNSRQESKNSLEDYLSIDLEINNKYIEGMKVNYYDSARNWLIQIADFFSNLYFSFLQRKDAYSPVIKSMWKEGYIRLALNFPYKEMVNNEGKTINV